MTRNLFNQDQNLAKWKSTALQIYTIQREDTVNRLDSSFSKGSHSENLDNLAWEFLIIHEHICQFMKNPVHVRSKKEKKKTLINIRNRGASNIYPQLWTVKGKQ